jgi:hypothetical protein
LFEVAFGATAKLEAAHANLQDLCVCCAPSAHQEAHHLKLLKSQLLLGDLDHLLQL